ncbi:MAG TPA: alkyl sulfatase dimerization domain-containing protein [Candidatus Binatia bacterium]|nr:alkyl sulfatase dimerization domain-containing protein [Candidatus Binatia bacterium]
MDQAPNMEGLYYASDQPEVVGDRVHLITGFGNSTCIESDDGLVIVDACVRAMGPRLLAQIRTLSDKPIRYVIYTHGHFDHAFGVWALLEEAQQRGWPRPIIVAHERVAQRFNRYRELAGQHDHINRIQFALPDTVKVSQEGTFFYPDVTYADRMLLRVGELTLELRHAMGETDDATWVWVPERRVVCSGDLFLWSCPNIGNPFKVQRYEVEWAEALEAMAALHPEGLAPGHGPAIGGAEKVRAACLDTARALRWLHDEVVGRLNAGQWAEQILAEVNALPPDLAAKPYLRPIYGCPTFIVHGILRRYGGWFDGNAANLFPSRGAAIAREVVQLADAARLLQRAKEIRGDDVQLALHLVDFVVHAGDHTHRRDALQLKSELLNARADIEPSFIARNIFRNGATRAAADAKA